MDRSIVEDLKLLCENEETQAEADEHGLTLFDQGCAAASERIVKEIRALIARHDTRK